MFTPWFVYLILLILIVICGAVMLVASSDPEGRAGNVARISLSLGVLLCVALVVIAALNIVRWIST